MDAPTDPAKLRAALEHLEAVQAQRVAEKIAAGEIVSVPLFIVAGSESEASAKVEEAKADKLAELRAAGDQREVKFDVVLVVTGVVRPGETADSASVPSAPTFALREDRPPLPPRPPVADETTSRDAPVDNTEELPPLIVETPICVQTRQCRDDDDPGAVVEGFFSVDGSTVTVTDVTGRHVGSRALLKDEDARVVAKRLLRGKTSEADDSFNRDLRYPSAGLA